MAFILSFLGWTAILLGGGWAGYTIYYNIGSVLDRGASEPLPSLLALAIATPGLTMVLAGLMLLAAGSALIRLDRIVNNTRDLLDELQARPTPVFTQTAAATSPPPGPQPAASTYTEQIEPRL